MLHTYYEQSIRALQLAGLSEGTQAVYTRAVRMLVDFYEKPPDLITEAELEDYFLYRRNVDRWANATLRGAYSGVRFFFINVLRRDWHLFTYLSAKKQRKLPSILDRVDVYQILGSIKTFHNFACLTTIYTCGLRIAEALALQVGDIDGKRLMVHVHFGKGDRDRYVPLPLETYHLLRRYWVTHRNPTLIFPARGRSRKDAPTTMRSMAAATVQAAFRQATHAVDISKRRVTVHTLRHCYATHLLEAGVNPRVVQQYMGHSKLETTMIYLHLTKKGTEDACQIINNTMRGFQFHDDHNQ